jgi:hypothetical protein
MMSRGFPITYMSGLNERGFTEFRGWAFAFDWLVLGLTVAILARIFHGSNSVPHNAPRRVP